MKRFALACLLITLFAIAALLAQTGHNKVEVTRWMADAKRFYDLDEPTAKTDSTALYLFLKAANAAQNAGDYLDAADCYIKVGNIHQTYQRYDESNRNYHAALYINQQYVNNSRINYEVYLYMGSSYYFSNIIDSAQYYFEKASAIASNNKDEKLPEEERLYNSLGTIYFESSNYLQAKNYFQKAILVTPMGTDDVEESLVGINNNIANCLLRLNQYDSALQIYKSLHRYKMQPEIKEIINQNTAHIYFEMGHYDSALVIYKKLSLANALNRIIALNDIGRIYMNREQWQQSETVFDSSIAVNKKISSLIRNKEEALAYLYRGQLAARQGLTDEAITWCNEALQEVHLNFTWKSMDDLPLDVSQTVSPLTLFEILRTKAMLLYKKFQRSNQQKFIRSSLQCYRKAIETANYIKLNFDNDEAKLFFNQNYQVFYSDAIAAAYAKEVSTNEGIDDYIFILENYKGNVLHQNLQNVLLKSSAQVPDSIKNREKELKHMLAFFTTRINKNAAETDALQLQQRLAELQVELSRLQKQYENDESYNLFRYQSVQDEINLEKIKSEIDKETALINYYKADTVIYLLAINKNKALLVKINEDTLFKQHLRKYLDEIYNHAEGKRYDGLQASANLYRTLLQPVASVIDDREKWVIIPDGVLYYLPVEGLTTEPDSRKYVIEQKTISYHYSFSLLFQKNTHHFNENEGREILAFAPYISRDAKINQTGLTSLPYSKDEVLQLGSNSFLSEAATKKRFIEVASRFPFIHLATHASAGTDSSGNWIQFYPADSNELNNKLFLNEIYNLDLHRAQLVVLSACETGSGHVTSGEGLLSLSRAFLYAGSDGIISTLWKSEDQVTAYLMQRLYHHLANDNTAGKALQLAKIDLLKEKSISAKYKTPNYWSNFIYVGKVSMSQQKGPEFWWLILIVLATVLTFFLLKQKRFRQKPEPQ